MEQTVLSIRDDEMATRGELIEYPAELIGGRNLLIDSTQILLDYSSSTRLIYKENDYVVVQRIGTASFSCFQFVQSHLTSLYDIINDWDQTYILSVDVKTDVDGFKLRLDVRGGGSSQITFHTQNIPNTNNEWQRIFYIFTLPNSGNRTQINFSLSPSIVNDGDILYYKNWQLTKGNKAPQSWTPAPEDLGLSYPDWVMAFKPSISENGILAPELIEYPAELIGGRNLFQQSNYSKHLHSQGTINNSATSAVVKVEPNTTYTVSYTVTNSNRFGIYQGDLEDGLLTSPLLNLSTIIAYVSTSAGEYIKETFTTKAIGEYITIYLNFGSSAIIKEPYLKLEKGTVATPWSPAPEDLGLSYPDWVMEFKPSISENGILIGSFTENPNL